MLGNFIVLALIVILLVSFFPPLLVLIILTLMLTSFIFDKNDHLSKIIRNFSKIIRNFKVRKIQKETVLVEVEKEVDLPLGNFGVFSYFSQGREEVLVVFPKLNQDGDLEYIYSWYDPLNVLFHSLKDERTQDENFAIMQELVIPIQEHLQVEQDTSKLQQQEEKIEQLLNLVSTSEVYSNQQELYERALWQVQEMIEKASKLEQVYIRLIREVLIGKELSNYDPTQIVNNHIAMDSQYKKVKEEYQQLKDTATAYTELLQNDKL